MKKFFQQYKLNWVAIIGLVIIILPFFAVGVVQAYDSWIRNQMENALSNNVKAAHETLAACESDYQALLQYKKDNGVALINSGDPCTF